MLVALATTLAILFIYEDRGSTFEKNVVKLVGLDLACPHAHADVGFLYFDQIESFGGTPPYTYSRGGSILLPSKLMLNSSGTVSGIPSVPGQVRDVLFVVFDSTLLSAQRLCRITTYNAPNIVCPAADAGEGLLYSSPIPIEGGGPTGFLHIIEGEIPLGTNFVNLTSNRIEGTPVQRGVYNFTFYGEDNAFGSALQACSIEVHPPVFASCIPGASLGIFYDEVFPVEGGLAPYTYQSFVGFLPTGLTGSPQGRVSGTPTSTGTFSFSLVVADTLGFTFPLSCSITVTNEPVPGCTAKESDVTIFYDHVVPVTGGASGPKSFALVSGSLPLGLQLNETSGRIFGTPLTTGTFEFEIEVTDKAKGSNRVNCDILVADLPSLNCPVLEQDDVGNFYDSTYSVSGGSDGTRIFALEGGALPTGTTLSALTGRVFGSLVQIGVFSSLVSVTDVAGGKAFANCNISVTFVSSTELWPRK